MEQDFFAELGKLQEAYFAELDAADEADAMAAKMMQEEA